MFSTAWKAHICIMESTLESVLGVASTLSLTHSQHQLLRRPKHKDRTCLLRASGRSPDIDVDETARPCERANAYSLSERATSSDCNTSPIIS